MTERRFSGLERSVNRKVDIQEIAVNTDTLQSDIKNMQISLDKVKRKTESMFQEIKILSGMWEGPAHDAFMRQFTVDYQKMKELQNVIGKLIDCMQYADKEYIACENEIYSIINTIRI